MDRELLDIKRIFSNERYSRDMISSAMRAFRMVMEKEKSKTKYLYLSLFCDWCLHPEINRSETGANLILNIVKSIVNNMKITEEDVHYHKWINDEIIENIGIHKLKEDIVAFGSMHNIECLKKIINIEEWKKFIVELLLIIDGVPIKIHKPSSKNDKRRALTKVYDEIINITNFLDDPLQPQLIFTQLELFLKDSKFCYKLISESNIVFEGPLAIVDQEMIDQLNVDIEKKQKMREMTATKSHN